MGEKFGDWVTDQSTIDHLNEYKTCVCGHEDVSLLGRFWKWYWCQECKRTYVSLDETAIHPEEILRTDEDGLVHASKDWDAFYLLTEHELDVNDYIEFPIEDEDEVWLWAVDGLYIGYLIYKYDTFYCLVIAEGFRRKGHGKQFVETWFDQLEQDEPIKVIYYDRTEPFLEKLDIPLQGFE